MTNEKKSAELQKIPSMEEDKLPASSSLPTSVVLSERP